MPFRGGGAPTPNGKCHFKFPFFSNLSQSDTIRRWKRYTHKYQNCSGIYASMHLLEEEKFPTWSGYPSRHHHDYLATSISLWFGTLANDHLNETDLAEASSHKDEIFAGENAASIAHHFIFQQRDICALCHLGDSHVFLLPKKTGFPILSYPAIIQHQSQLTTAYLFTLATINNQNHCLNCHKLKP